MSFREKAAQRRAAREAQRSRVGERAQEVRGKVRAQASALCAAPGKATPGTFSRLYASRDEALQVFEDAEGHLTSVNAARFA